MSNCRSISYSTCHKLAKEKKECIFAEFIWPLEGSRHTKLLHEVSYLFILRPRPTKVQNEKEQKQNMDPFGDVHI